MTEGPIKRERTFTWSDPAGTAEMLGAGLSGYDLIKAMLDGEIPHAPIAEALDFQLHEVERGRVVFRSRPQEFHYNPIGTVHGGFYGTLLDSCMSCAIHTMLDGGKGYTTLEYKINLVRALSDDVGEIFAEGNLVHLGRRIATADGRVVDAAGKLYARGTVTCIILS